ncbi:DUF5709 domain-containing protein [Streptomyces sp. H27-D2]|uniref:DUF5709 domain-containing protein n=1 Tax=Streptomyces sp. H27-D2 TaxID=3046304 RepID=UPI002DBACD88|nr:DUF5709 domain-containing protein [Streptomyces sp. H27-D2]MEC4020319.1 DUF5709 domain-containing protein [Streptomyces sp. H27-D2]
MSEMGDEVYQPDGSGAPDDSGVLEPEDTLDHRGVDSVLDEGYSPPERPMAVEGKGVTAAEQRSGETLDQRLSEELPDVAAPDGDGLGDTPDSDGELIDDEVGDARAGRLVAPDEGAHSAEASGSVGSDVGIDGGAASAEEAAMHVVGGSEGSDS